MAGVAQPGIVGAREDLTDKIMMFKAESTPVLSMAPKGPPPTNETHEWQADLPARVQRRGSRDNSPAPTATWMTADRRKLQSYNHWIQVSISTGKKAEKINDVAGIGKGKLYAIEKMKGLKALKTAVDRVLGDDTDCRAEQGDTGSETRGLGSWIQATAQTTLPVPAAYRASSTMIYAGTKAAFKEETFRDMATFQFTRTDEPTSLKVAAGAALKRHISDWSIADTNQTGKTLLRQVNTDMKARVLSAVVDIIEADGCTYEIFPSNNLGWDRTDETSNYPDSQSQWRGYLLDTKGLELAFAQGFEHMPLPNDGGGTRGMLDVIFALSCTPLLMGKIAPSDA